jgi:uncharacterized RDD family membrane protein YckC
MAEEWVEQKYGGFWIRFLAYLIDSLILGIGFVAVMMLLGMMGLELFSPEIIFAVVAILYWAGMHASGRQATYGKALVGLKVTGTIGDRVSIVKALVRELAKILSTMTFLIGYILAGLTKRKQALHDFIASTQVVRAEPGHVVAAVAVAIVALCAPVVVGMFFGMGFVAGALGEIAGTVLTSPEIVAQAPTPAAPAPKPAAKPQVAQPKPAAVEPKVVQVAAAPAVVTQPAEPPKAVSTAMVLAQATEPAKPAPAKEAAKPAETAKPAPIVVQSAEPKPARKPRAKAAVEPKPEALPKEAAAPKAEPKPEPAPAPAAAMEEPAVEPVPMASGPGPKFNDLMTAVIYQDAKTVDQLLGYGKWADKPDSRGVTPLMVAAMLGDGPIAESLLKGGANPNLPGPGGDTATSIARQKSDAAMLGLLRRHGGR